MANGYKVCKLLDSKYYSASVSKSTDLGAVEYAIGSTSTPASGCGPLTVFQKESQATDWLESWAGINTAARAHYTIFRCHYTPTSGQHVFYSSSTTEDHFTTHVSKCPAGTVLASSITLLSRTRWE